MPETIIIAEAGVNHNGSIELALKLIDAAAEAGADYVKFQTFKADKLVTKDALKARYQKENSGTGETQFEMLRKLELSPDDHEQLIKHCRLKKIKFLSTAFDVESIDLLSRLGIDFFKIPSGEITNLPYLRKIAKLKKPVIISTGMSELEEIRDAVEVFLSSGLGKSEISILHCNTEYPTPMQDVNLRAMLSLREEFDVTIGYSDHTLGIEVPVAAVALGAKIIEKHFTLDRNMEGPDHKASLEPSELIQMVKCIRNIEKALGDSGKKVSPSEIKNKTVARKSIFFCNDLPQGHVITEEDLIMKRPGDGISPMKMDSVLGKSLRKNVKRDDMLKWEDLL